jgi:aspartate kinase
MQKTKANKSSGTQESLAGIKVMKFGGTSVGKPHRMHEVAGLITKDKETKIVVLSAVSGTTNSLVEIGNYLLNGNKEEAKKKIDTLEAQYQAFVKELVIKPDALQKGRIAVYQAFQYIPG